MDPGHVEAPAPKGSETTEDSPRGQSTVPHVCDDCRCFVYGESRYATPDLDSGRCHVPLKEKFQRHFSLVDLDLLATHCEVYQLFRWQLLKRSAALGLVIDWVEFADPKFLWDHGLRSFQIQCQAKWLKKQELEDSNLYFSISAASGTCSQKLGIERGVTPAYGLSPERVSIMQKWIPSERERQPQTPRSIAPARLIFVDQDHCRLVTISKLTELDTVEYATLTYCWGDPAKGDAPLKTTSKTVAFWEAERIPEDLMPQTLQDAVVIVRCLGIKYLWIDSLCIIQDNDEDWQEESQKMAQIYQDSLITIASLTVESCHDSILKPSALPKVEVLYAPSSSETYGSYFLEAQHITQFQFQEATDLNGYLERKISQSTWHKRGWTFQEYYFAHQLLIFAESEMFFSEGRIAHSESGTRFRGREGPHLVNIRRDHHDSDLVSMTRPDHAQKGAWVPFQYDLFWYDAIYQYSGRMFTVETDRLPAIASYAQVAAEENGDEYIAGLWGSELPRGLLWVTEPCSQSELSRLLHENPQIVGHTPSWSWARSGKRASWPGGQLFGGFDHEGTATCTVEDAFIFLNSSNRFGQVDGASLMLSGMAMRLSYLRPEKGSQGTYQGWIDDTLVTECWTDWDVPAHCGKWMTDFLTRQTEGLLMFHTFSKPPTPAECVGSMQPSPCQMGVILVPTETEGKYWRVGVFKVLSEFFFAVAENQTVIII